MWKEWKDTALKNGISNANFRQRAKRWNWTPEKAATTPIRNSKKRTDREWIELAEKNGICYQTYLGRVNERFWDPEKAATTPVMSRKKVSQIALKAQAEYRQIIEDRIYKDPNNLFKLTNKHYAIALKNGICKNTVRWRVQNSGWTVQDAITTPVKGKERTKEFYYYRDIAKSNGIASSTFNSRVIVSGWTLEDAATIKPKSKKDSNMWLNLARRNGIKPSTFYGRLKRGWNPKEAATIEPLQKGQYSPQGKEKHKKVYNKFIQK